METSGREMLDRARKEHERDFLFKCLFLSRAIKAFVVVSFLAALEFRPGKQEALSWLLTERTHIMQLSISPHDAEDDGQAPLGGDQTASGLELDEQRVLTLQMH